MKSESTSRKKTARRATARTRGSRAPHVASSSVSKRSPKRPSGSPRHSVKERTAKERGAKERGAKERTAKVRTAPQRAAQERSERQRDIVEAASRLFADRGYSSCDMDRIAAQLKIAKGTLYLYFSSKQDLFFACVDHGMNRMQEAVSQAGDTTDDPFERLARSIRAYLVFFADHPQYVELILQERAIFRDRKRSTYLEHRAAARVRWRSFYEQLIDAGRLRSNLNVEWIMDTLGNLVYGTMFTNHFSGRTTPVVDQHRQMLDIVLHGLLSDNERQRFAESQP